MDKHPIPPIEDIIEQFHEVKENLLDLDVLCYNLSDKDNPEELKALHAYLQEHVNDIYEAFNLTYKAFVLSETREHIEDNEKLQNKRCVMNREPSFEVITPLLGHIYKKSTETGIRVKLMYTETPDEVREAVWLFARNNGDKIADLKKMVEKALTPKEDTTHTREDRP